MDIEDVAVEELMVTLDLRVMKIANPKSKGRSLKMALFRLNLVLVLGWFLFQIRLYNPPKALFSASQTLLSCQDMMHIRFTKYCIMMVDAYFQFFKTDFMCIVLGCLCKILRIKNLT